MMPFARDPAMFRKQYGDLANANPLWKGISGAAGQVYDWPASTYIAKPPFFDGFRMTFGGVADIKGARALGIFGDSVTTDHISPAGSIKESSPAGKWLVANNVRKADFNSYGSRRGNHEVMMRGTFANIRIRNEMLGGEEGGNTIYIPTGEKIPIYDAAMRYQAAGTPLVVIAGKEYGTGSSRDWAAKGTNLLGVKAVIAESFERIHRSNLVGMGVLPLQFKLDQNRKTLNLTGKETLDILGLTNVELTPRMNLTLVITRPDGSREKVEVLCRIDTLNEVEYFKSGGILHYVLRQLIAS
jgi:aconitate hydratase